MVGQFVLFCFYADQLKTAMVSKQSELTVDNREFKKLRRLLQRKRHFKVELWVRLTFLRLFQVGHFVTNKRGARSFAWHEWFSCKGKDLLLRYRVVVKTSIISRTSTLGRLSKKIASKSESYVQHDYFSSFNQSNNLVPMVSPLPERPWDRGRQSNH